MNPVELYDDKCFKILWNEADRVIGIDWKETTARSSTQTTPYVSSPFDRSRPGSRFNTATYFKFR
jgi:hypothetical protein